MDATMTVTGDHKKMSVDDANVQTTHKENAVSASTELRMIANYCV